MGPGTKGLLLVNLGTPEGTPGKGPSVAQVRRYLRQFLMDPDVVDIPPPLRWLLVHAIVLPRRPAKTASAYHKIWTGRGSPLLFHEEDLTRSVQTRLRHEDPSWRVALAMRYGQPSIEKGLSQLQEAGIQEALVVPLYPQYSLAATASSIKGCERWAARLGMRLRFFPAFYNSPGFLEAFAAVARESLKDYRFDHMLFSFHGLPERQVKRTDATGKHCFQSSGCCDQVTGANRDCYRAQCFSTARELARRLGIEEARYTVCFQSRLGRTPWITPYTDIVYGQLVEKGLRRVAVMCPAFVADCLETLEEVQIRGRDQFLGLGGEELKLVPSLNASPVWVDALTRMIQEFCAAQAA